ncbi:MAG TPA: isomerizing glutamine--fructose-6-phosphate transaminase [Candidatus Angelobacter sp.]|nr:isomerizing glutamine--fructose-6-phosphate transaminase [Candidatus Angelobacter sp.]
MQINNSQEFLPGTGGVDRYAVARGGFAHFMLKEIYDQPEAARSMIEGCVDGSGHVTLPGFSLSPDEIRAFSKISIAGSGSSRHAGIVGEFMLERITRLPVEVDFASQYCYRDPLADPNELCIFISQSGTTVDTLAALHQARRKGSKSVAICNVSDSPLTRNADATLLTHAGEEVAIAATKSFTSQLVALLLLSAYIAQNQITKNESKVHARVQAAVRQLRFLPKLIEAVLTVNEKCREYAEEFGRCSDFIFAGRDIDYAIALEGALKLKEVCYIHAQAYPTGELKHGPAALIDKRLPMVVLATHDQQDEGSVLRYQKSVSMIRELAEREIPVLAIITEGDQEIPGVASHVVSVPAIPVLLQPILEVIPLQFLAYHIAVLGGHNVDQPRNLCKSVVME